MHPPHRSSSPADSDEVHRVGEAEQAAAGGLVGAQARGELAKDAWVRDAEVVSADILSQAWGTTPMALAQAAARGELCEVLVRGQWYYPAEFLQIASGEVATINSQIRTMDSSAQFVFWKRKHGGLGGKTVLEALSSDRSPIANVIAVAKAVVAQQLADDN